MSRSAQGMLFGRFGAIGAVVLLGGALDVDGAEARAFRLELEAPRERAEAAVEAIRPNDDVVPPAYSLTASSSSRNESGTPPQLVREVVDQWTQALPRTVGRPRSPSRVTRFASGRQ